VGSAPVVCSSRGQLRAHSKVAVRVDGHDVQGGRSSRSANHLDLVLTADWGSAPDRLRGLTPRACLDYGLSSSPWKVLVNVTRLLEVSCIVPRSNEPSLHGATMVAVSRKSVTLPSTFPEHVTPLVVSV
jgi:hypothetical protein